MNDDVFPEATARSQDHDGSGIAGGHCANYDFELRVGNMANNINSGLIVLFNRSHD